MGVEPTVIAGEPRAGSVPLQYRACFSHEHKSSFHPRPPSHFAMSVSVGHQKGRDVEAS